MRTVFADFRRGPADRVLVIIVFLNCWILFVMSNVLLWLPTCYKYPFTRTACLKAVGPTVKSKEVGKGDKSGKKSRCKNSQFTFGD